MSDKTGPIFTHQQTHAQEPKLRQVSIGPEFVLGVVNFPWMADWITATSSDLCAKRSDTVILLIKVGLVISESSLARSLDAISNYSKSVTICYANGYVHTINDRR